MADASLSQLATAIGSNPYLQLLPASSVAHSRALFAAERPSSLLERYNSGSLMGVLLDVPELPWYIRRAARWFEDALRDLRDEPLVWEDTPRRNACLGMSETGRSLGWKAWMSIDLKMASKGNQLTGDCVSWAIRGSRDRLRSHRIVSGQQEAYICRQATCGIYCGRGWAGEGMNSGMASEWAVKIGTLLEQTYLDGKYDFRDYTKYVNWGISRWRSKMPADLLEITSKVTDEKTYLVTTWEGFVDALSAGYTAHAGSMLGVANRGTPVSGRGPRPWAHDMDFPGYDITKEDVPEEVVFGDNSWGLWNEVTNIPERWKPWGEGMFAITRELFERIVLPARGCYVFVPGEYFPADPINNFLL